MLLPNHHQHSTMITAGVDGLPCVELFINKTKSVRSPSKFSSLIMSCDVWLKCLYMFCSCRGVSTPVRDTFQDSCHFIMLIAVQCMQILPKWKMAMYKYLIVWDWPKQHKCYSTLRSVFLTFLTYSCFRQYGPFLVSTKSTQIGTTRSSPTNACRTKTKLVQFQNPFPIIYPNPKCWMGENVFIYIHLWTIVIQNPGNN